MRDRVYSTYRHPERSEGSGFRRKPVMFLYRNCATRTVVKERNRCSTCDEGRSLGVDLQEKASNCPTLLRHNGWGDERIGKRH